MKPLHRNIRGLLLILLVFLLGVNLPGKARSVVLQGEDPSGKLLFADAVIDDQGNLYVIVNTWTSLQKNLVRILPDGTIDDKFRLERFSSCCTVNPYLVDTDADGNIYVLTYRGWVGSYALIKYTPDGELFEDFGGNGMAELSFVNPVDLAVRPDGVAYVLDADEPEVYAVSRDGGEDAGFVYQYYSLIKPSKLELGPNNEIYIFDLFDSEFSYYDISAGIVALNPNGTPVEYFGYDWEAINSDADPVNHQTFVVDADGTLWVLGSLSDAGPYSAVFHYDRNGNKLGAFPLELRLGDEDLALGIIADNKTGFIIFEIDNLSLVVMHYGRDGKLVEKYSVEVFKRKF